MTSNDEPVAIYIQMSDCGRFLRKWDREPFDGAATFYRHIPAPPAEDAVEAVRCQHEPYHGRCVHCDIPFRDGQPNYGDYPALSSLKESGR